MKIDFSMTGLNLSLLIGLALLIQSICLLFMQRPIKRLRKFTVKDYVIFAFLICVGIAGIVLTVMGIISAFRMIG